LVLVTPVLILLVTLIIQFALWFHATHVAQAAASDGLASVRVEAGTAADGETRANAILDSLAPTLITDRQVVATRGAQTARVEVTGNSVTIVPGFTLRIHAVAEGPLELFTIPGSSSA
jgi:Flp pilus assembly protein TadG